MCAILLVQGLMLILTQLPGGESQPEQGLGFDVDLPEIALIDEIEITRQQGAPPSPRKPSYAPPVPRDVILEDPLMVPDENLLADLPPLADSGGRGGAGDSREVVQRPQRPPSPLKIVEPQLEAILDASMRGRVRIRMNFLVDERGRVEEASIIEILVTGEDGTEQRVPFLKNGLDEAALKAALQWEFRPARHEGTPVRAYATGTFRF